MNRSSTPYSQRGLTLVEIMVAVVIGLVLMAGILQIFIGSKQAYRVQEAMGRVQENGRVALEIMARDIRTADNWGCSYLTDNNGKSLITNNLPAGPGFIDFTQFGGLLILASGNGADSFLMAGTSGSGQAVTAFNRTAGTITVASTTGFNVGNNVLIGDCEKGDIFRVTAVDTVNSTLGFNANLSKTYDNRAQVYPLGVSQYAIQTGSNGRNALFRNVNGINQELIENVDSLTVLYGEDTNADGAVDAYSAGGAVGSAANVKALRVSMVMASAQDNIVSTKNSNDYRLRKTFNSTMRLRNR